MNGEFPYFETDTLLQELKDAAFECLLIHPGSEFADWRNNLIEQYPAEVVDALGNIPDEVYAGLADLWETDYTDPNTGLCQAYKEWAEAFTNEAAVGIYYHHVEACRKLRRLNHKFP